MGNFTIEGCIEHFRLKNGSSHVGRVDAKTGNPSTDMRGRCEKDILKYVGAALGWQALLNCAHS